MLDLVTSPSLTVNREHSDILKLNLSNTYATIPDDIEGELAVLIHGLLSLDAKQLGVYVLGLEKNSDGQA